ncbi:MAG: hypothetical protein ACRDJ5_04975, partial [Actinomycetota bacterium]
MSKARTRRARAKKAEEARRVAQARRAPRGPREVEPVPTYIDWSLVLKSVAMFSLIGAGTIHAVWM